jgi:ABC-type nitrate/sulfonate/bicarbonate transport system permease component
VRRFSWRVVLPPATVVVGTIAAWELIVVATGLPPFILPSPGAVIAAGLETQQVLGRAIVTTLTETLLGLAIAIVLGVAFAALMDLVPIVRKALYPLLVASQTVQILAVAPLLVIWFGFGMTPNVIVVVLFTFFPMTISTVDGLTSTDPDYVALLRSMRATRGQIWRMVRLPAALPSFFSGLRLSVTYSVVAATVGEWVGGSGGLGLYMLRSKNALQTDQVFVAMLITTLLSIGLFTIVFIIEHLALPWYYTAQRKEQWEEQGVY